MILFCDSPHLASLNACELFNVGELTIRVQGTVTAADDGTPVAGVTLLVLGFGFRPAEEGYTTLASGDWDKYRPSQAGGVNLRVHAAPTLTMA